ncbi:hypothetical protein EUBVEN_00052, partial [Eubacterium ventriosum ATCC 27560]
GRSLQHFDKGRDAGAELPDIRSGVVRFDGDIRDVVP